MTCRPIHIFAFAVLFCCVVTACGETPQPGPQAVTPTVEVSSTVTPTLLPPTSTPAPTPTPTPSLTKDGLHYVNLGLPGGDSYSPVVVASDPKLHRLYVYNSYNGQDGQDTLSVLRSDTLEITGTVHLGGSQTSPSLASQLAVDSVTHRIYALNGDGRALLILDGDSLNILFIVHGARRVALAPEAGRVYIINDVGQIKALSATDYRELASQNWTEGFEADLIAYNAANDGLYLARWDFVNKGSLVVLDGTTLQKKAEMPLSSAPYDLQIDPMANEIYVATDTGVAIISGSTNAVVKQLNLNMDNYNPSRSLTVDPARHRLYVSFNAGLTLSAGGGLAVIDTATRSIVRRTQTTYSWQDIFFEPAEGALYAAPAMNDALLVVDGDGNVKQRVMLGLLLLDIQVEPDTGQLWAVDSGGTVRVLDGSDLRETKKQENVVGGLDGAIETSNLALTEANAYIADQNRRTTVALDTQTLQVLQKIKAAGPLAIDMRGQRLFVVDDGIQVYGLGTGKPVAKITIPPGNWELRATDIKYEPRTDRLYVKLRGGGTASAYRTYWRMYNGLDLSSMATFNPNNRDVEGMAVAPEASRVYLTYAGSSDWDKGLAVYDSGGAELDRLQGVTGQLIASPDRAYLYVLRPTAIWVLDRQNLEPVALLPLSESYDQMVMDPKGQWLYLRRGATVAMQSVKDLLDGKMHPLKRLPESMGLPASTYRSPLFETDQTIYALVPGDGVYRSTDGGQNWQLSSRGLRDLYVTGLTFSTNFATDGTVQAKAGRVLYRSRDKGETWLKASAWAPVVAFVSDRDGKPEIYTMNEDGSQVRRLAKDGVPGQHPRWSPDDNWLAFDSKREGNSDIYVVQADGYGLGRLTSDPADDTEPAWSPDGGRIAFVSTRDGNPEIYIMNADGTNAVRLTNDPAADRQPAWSPDGNHLAFTSNRDGDDEIYVLGLDTNEVTRLTDNQQQDSSPAWSPDGQWLAFVSDRTGNSDVFRMRADGTQIVQLTNAPSKEVEPTWSANGRSLAFASNRTGNFQLYTTDLGGGSWRRLTVGSATDTSPAWVHK